MRFRVLAALFSAAAGAGCSEDAMAPPGSRLLPPRSEVTPGVVADPPRDAEASAQALARAVAIALRSDGVRAQLRDALRASPFTEHKLALRHFAGTASGRALVTAAGTGSGLGPNAIGSIIANLPEMDLYVPVREHRLTWRGGDDILVAATLTPSPPAVAYAVDGSSVQLDLAREGDPGAALLLLQFAEQKSRRIIRQAARAGLTIQDTDDGDLSGELVTIEAGGTTIVRPLADLPGLIGWDPANVQTCPDPSGCSGGGGGTSPPPPPPPQAITRLRGLETKGVCDNGFCGEGNEFEFRARASNGTRSTLRIEGVPSTYAATLSVTLIQTSPNLVAYIDVDVVETDGGLNLDGDDHFDYVTYNPNTVSNPRLVQGESLRT